MEMAEAAQGEATEGAGATEFEEGAEQHEQEESGAAEGAAESGEGAADDGGEIVVSIAGAEPAAEDAEAERAPAWVRDLRKANREKDRRIRELEQRLNAPAQDQAAVVVGAKPTLEACDYDADKFAAELEQWHDRKRQADEQTKRQAEAEQSAQQAWRNKLQGYEQATASLGQKIKGAAEAEEIARDTFSLVQQGIVVQGLPPEDAAKMMVALGQTPSRLQKLAAIADPVQFAVAVGELKRDIQVTPQRKQAPAPEKVVRAAGALPAVGAAAVEKLKAEANKTGDYSKYFEAKRKLKG